MLQWQWASGGLKQEQEQRAHMRAPALGYVVDVPSSDSSERLRLADVDLLDHVCRGVATLVLLWQQWKSLQVLKRQLFDRARAWGWGISDQAATRNFTTSPCACEMQLDLFMIHSHPHHLELFLIHNNNNFQYCSRRKQNKISPWKRNNEALNCSEVWSWYCSPIKAGWIQGRWCSGECDAF